MENEIRPNNAEIEFLTLAYNRFYDIYDEIFNDNFWVADSYYRFSKERDIFAIYTEILNYEPIKWVIEYLKKSRPPMEAKIGSELFKFIRNVLAHFAFFDCWDDVYINKSLINWHKAGQSIDQFLIKYCGHTEIKYRFWESSKKKMTYLSIKFPEKYANENIYLKNIISEKDGIKFSSILMRKIIDTQVVSISEK